MHLDQTERSIPACAGEAIHCACCCNINRVDPRMRGGGTSPVSVSGSRAGRSPHARGRLDDKIKALVLDRSIPACAGEAIYRHERRRTDRVDPRMRGGGFNFHNQTRPEKGRSPHARGRLMALFIANPVVGSIPACAGEARQDRRRDTKGEVDPRMRGGGQLCKDRDIDNEGRSPPARGRPYGCPAVLSGVRSIPACAGEAVESLALLV